MSIQGGVVEYSYPGDVLTFTADGAITGGDLVELQGTSFEVRVATDESLACIGVALHTAADGENVSVARVGVYYLTAEGAINAGDQIVCGAAGDAKALAATATAVAEDINDARALVGRALEDIADNATGRIALMLG